MGQALDTGDIIDMLEESATTGLPVVVSTNDGRQFTDRVADVVTENGQDFAEFQDNPRLAVKEILHCAPAEGTAAQASYDDKL